MKKTINEKISDIGRFRFKKKYLKGRCWPLLTDPVTHKKHKKITNITFFILLFLKQNTKL